MWKLFRRTAPDPTSIVSERWESRFFWKHHARFSEEKTDDYEARFRGRELVLTLARKNLFAWVNDPLYRYQDFVVEAEISTPLDAGYSSAGLLFRYVDEANYYYFLISTRGYFRFDVVFNGNPIRLIDWTQLPDASVLSRTARQEAGGQRASGGGPSFTMFVVANGTRFTLGYNERWIAEIDDETIDAGGIAFGVQNYDERDQVSASLRHVVIDSRGLAVETFHYRWREAVPVDPESRLRLARSLFASDNPTAALIQVRRALKTKKPDAPTLFFLAECQISLGLHDNALENVERSLALEPDGTEAQHEKANLLYLLGRYTELRDYLTSRVAGSESSTLWNLFGHAHYSLGRWQEAAEAYSRAVELEPEMPLFHVNAARAYERTEHANIALEHYLIAGRLFVRQDAIEDLAKVVPSIMSLDPSSREGRAFGGIVAFQEGNLAEAGGVFDLLVREGYEDSAVLYLLGLIRSRAGDKRAALLLFSRAAELEPDFALYWFRLAETEYLLGENPSASLDRALRLAPDDQWILNLAGQIHLDTDRVTEALDLLARAETIAPEEPDIAINYAEALFRSGRVDEAIALLDRRDEARVYNTLGNFYTRLGRSEEALAAYERAYAIDPDDPIIAENLAAACIEADLVNRAEELLGRLVERTPSASVLNRVGNLARIEGDLVRAEAAYREALGALSLPDIDRSLSEEELKRLSGSSELNETAAEIEANLTELYLQWFRYEHARRIVDRLASHAPSPRTKKLEERLRSATEVRFSCASCGREWWAPRNVDVPSVLRLHGEPPEEAPAGQCGRCGKVYCVGCAIDHLKGDRFVCPDCDEYLKLNDDHLKYLILKTVEVSQKGRS